MRAGYVVALGTEERKTVSLAQQTVKQLPTPDCLTNAVKRSVSIDEETGKEEHTFLAFRAITHQSSG